VQRARERLLVAGRSQRRIERPAEIGQRDANRPLLTRRRDDGDALALSAGVASGDEQDDRR
jgi:hypothetical protein